MAFGEPLSIPRSELFGRLQKLMFLRVLFVSMLLGASVFVQMKETKTAFGDIQTYHYLLIAAIYSITVIYVILLKRLENLLRFAYLQLLVDTILVTAIIYATGGIESIFSFLYILTIINGSIILYRKGGMTAASSCSILYGLLIDLHYYRLIEPLGSRLTYPADYQGSYIFYMILVNIAAFYLVAFLSSYPSEQARKSRAELKAKQADIIKLEALNEWIIRSMTSGLITLDDQGRILVFNPAAEALFGISAGTCTGQKVLEVLPFLSGHEGLGESEWSLHAGKHQYFIDLPYVRPNGERIFLRASVSPLRLEGGAPGGRILFFQDMTKMKEIEEEMKRVEGLALIGELAAGIAHEIRNPMASISGSIQMLKESLEMDDVKTKLMDIMLREINRLNSLVSDFLLFARPKRSSVQTVDLNQLILDSLELFKHSAKWKEKIRVETQFHGPVTVESDAEQIKQVLWNLFLNAVEAMRGEGVLSVSTGFVDSGETQSGQRRMAQLVFRDTGEGFSSKALQFLFTPFFTTKEGGSGLGLAIVKRIVEGLKGSVSGRNHPDGGAEITVRLDPFLGRSA
ncbi:MAG: two-component system sensor histidine kinase NtrB [Deltaproteobacteria bacterium]